MAVAFGWQLPGARSPPARRGAARQTLKRVDPSTGVVFVEGTAGALTESTCPGTTEDRAADGSIPIDVACAFATVRWAHRTTMTTRIIDARRQCP